MLERDIEKYMVSRCTELGVLCYKFTSPQRRNVPDRILIYHGHTIFVELKATGKKPNAGQLRAHERLAEHSYYVTVIDSIQGVENCLQFILDLDHTDNE